MHVRKHASRTVLPIDGSDFSLNLFFNPTKYLTPFDQMDQTMNPLYRLPGHGRLISKFLHNPYLERFFCSPLLSKFGLLSQNLAKGTLILHVGPR
jgi:hypothetical protein